MHPQKALHLHFEHDVMGKPDRHTVLLRHHYPYRTNLNQRILILSCFRQWAEVCDRCSTLD